MRKSLLLAIVLAIVAMPMALAGVGLCRSMPCCRPHLAATASQMHQPHCCKTTNCDQPPDVTGEYTKTSRVDHQHGLFMLGPVVIVPVVATIGPPRETWDRFPTIAPPSLQRRIALLSVLLI